MLFNVIYINRTLTINHENTHNDIFMLLVLTVLGFLVNWMNTRVCDVWDFCSFVIFFYILRLLWQWFCLSEYECCFVFCTISVCLACFTGTVLSIQGVLRLFHSCYRVYTWRYFFTGIILCLKMCFVCFPGVVVSSRDVLCCFIGFIVFIRDVLCLFLSCFSIGMHVICFLLTVYRNALCLFDSWCSIYPWCVGLFHWCCSEYPESALFSGGCLVYPECALLVSLVLLI